MTGGTALSRAYYKHRYSDDLDFFVNNDDDYLEQVKEIFFRLREDGFFWDTEVDFISAKTFTSFKVRWGRTEAVLKLDFVNDVAAHFGEIVKAGIFDRIDSLRNILSNKLTAVFRFDAKDVADIREIALHESVDWVQTIKDARQKAAGVELTYISDILTGMPQQEFETIAWIKKPEWDVFCEDINRIVFDMMSAD